MAADPFYSERSTPMFRYDSPFMRFMALVANLILLNLLWIITSLPLVTAGASTTAMYYVVLQYVNKQDDAVLKPFLKSFKDNFKQATKIWIPHGLIGLALVAEYFYLTINKTDSLWWLIFVVMAGVYLLISGMLYPMLARYENVTRAIVFNSINLSFRNFFPMLTTVILNFAPIGLLMIDYEVFLRTLPLWTFGGFSLIAYLNAIIVMRIFKKYDNPEDDQN